MAAYKHPYHMVDPSPWPYISGQGALGVAVGLVLWFQGYEKATVVTLWGLFMLLWMMFEWWRDVIREGTFQGAHTIRVQRGLRWGMILFIISEVCFFFGFFWGFFHSALGPGIEIGSVWPPVGVQVLETFDVPLLNTAILLTSGATVTWAHHALINGDRDNTLKALILTIVLGIVFTGFQAMEYLEASFSIADSVFGSAFFICTGAHGCHVLIGTLFLIVCLFRIIANQFTKHHHNGLEAAIMYWHFVDYVWIFLFISVYWWTEYGFFG